MAENIKRHITHIKSKVVESSSPKLPAASQIELGEIAVNYANGYETLSIKNDSGNVVTFSEDKIIGKKGKLTGYAKASSASAVGTGDTINTAIGKLEKALDGKSNTGHAHQASDVTGFTGYSMASASASVLTTDTLLQVIGKLEKRIKLLETALDNESGLKFKRITQSQYDALTTKDSNTLYIIV